MNDKSYVSLERHVCLVCGVAFDTGKLLLDKRLRASMEHYTTTGWGLCEERRRLFEAGYVALIECDLARSDVPIGGKLMKPEQAHRTGRVAHLRREVFPRALGEPAEEGRPCVFVEAGVIAQLEAMTVPRSN